MKYIGYLVVGFYCFISLSITSANASIVYSGRLDIDASTLSVDFNDDGSIDFSTNWRMWGGGNGYSTSGFDAELNFDIRFLNTELGGIHAGHGFPGTKAPLEHGELIGSVPSPALQWSYGSNTAMMWTTYDVWNTPRVNYSGLWHDVDNKYLGFELTADSNYYYGWVQLDTDALNNIVLVDFAYENISGMPIAAGIAPVPLPASIYFLLSGALMFVFRSAKKNN